MGILIEVMKNKTFAYWLSIIFDIILAIIFIYLSLQVREYYLRCYCPPNYQILKEILDRQINSSVKP
jgi:hypothetical protein